VLLLESEPARAEEHDRVIGKRRSSTTLESVNGTFVRVGVREW
jgi:hypothetical protein